MKKPVDFDWYCKAKKDVINNAAYELIVALTAKSAPPRKFELSIPQRDDCQCCRGRYQRGRSSDRLLLPSILSGVGQAPVLPRQSL